MYLDKFNTITLDKGWVGVERGLDPKSTTTE